MSIISSLKSTAKNHPVATIYGTYVVSIVVGTVITTWAAKKPETAN